MRTTRILLAVGCVSGIALGTLASAPRATAQYYPPPPGYGYGYGYHHRTWNGCPPGWTVQGGNCAPYKGPGGWRLEHLEWVPTRLHGTGWKLRTVPRSLNPPLLRQTRPLIL
jgi:hypothetical protein